MRLRAELRGEPRVDRLPTMLRLPFRTSKRGYVIGGEDGLDNRERAIESNSVQTTVLRTSERRTLQSAAGLARTIGTRRTVRPRC